jgi:glutathione peroxidase
MSLYDVAIHDLQGKPLSLDGFRDRALLIVNVASRCGMTPQYFGLEALQKEFGERGLTVLGVPCNQFAGQEPGTGEEIAEFCATTYGVTFPMVEKVEVNGAGRHPLYDRLVDTPDAGGHSGDIRWNFEKFVVAPGGAVTARFGPQVTPEDPALREAVAAALPA